MRNSGFEMFYTFRLFYAVVVTKFIGVRDTKFPLEWWIDTHHVFSGNKKGDAFLNHPSERNRSLRELDANT